MSYVIITDSTTDLTIDLINKLELNVMPLTFTLDNKEYLNYPDQRELTNKEFYDALRNGSMATTSQLNIVDIVKYYEEFLAQGLDILSVVFSSGLSGSFNAVRLAKDELLEKYPERKIVIIDSLCASMGEGLFAYYAAKNRLDGMSIEENERFLLDNVYHLAHWFTVSDLDFLRRGGRLSNASAFVAKVLKINPVLNVDNQGHLVGRIKKIGRKNAINALIDKFDKTALKDKKQVVFISHGDCLNDALYVRDCLMKKYSDCISQIEIGEIGPVIGAHSGPGTLALFFLATER